MVVNMKFSVLLSIYYKEKVSYFNRAMQSIWDEQTKRPNEIVLVQDGKLTDELYKVIDEWQVKLGNTLKVIPLKENIGLGDALNIGLNKCSHELVARMDTDDISVDDRFEKQVKQFKDTDIDICSSWVSEFEDREEYIVSYRKLPEYHTELLRFSKKRNPLNHPAVMYKKSAVNRAGGYKKMPYFEDYYLWGRMMLNGSKFYNIQESLVNMRAGCSQLERRGGIRYAMSEIVLQKEFLKLHFINIFEFMRNVIIRFSSRLMPKYLLKKIYSKIHK
ncbi:MAG: putative glycosyltransferase [uncultured Sulfurovum sp.]|uniref:Putative glycosyltransferase n=1 Tax=uncultured Sulfurovum sp. TaxID=269237 RepID=A0A6S6SZF4_9BACT|nr:MAG: putative glycosyltransferase [uncultured Sulfurovum sp.]